MATFREFITECELWEYSKEHYELMKECAELDLMNKYIENVEFTQTITEYYGDSEKLFSEGYLMESTNLEPIYEAAKKKSEGIIAKIVALFKALVNKFLIFLKKRKEAKYGKLAVKIADITNANPAKVSSCISKAKSVVTKGGTFAIAGVGVFLKLKSIFADYKELEDRDGKRDKVNREGVKAIFRAVDDGKYPLETRGKYNPKDLADMIQILDKYGSFYSADDYGRLKEILEKRLDNPIYTCDVKATRNPAFGNGLTKLTQALDKANEFIDHMKHNEEMYGREGQSISNLTAIQTMLAQATANTIALENYGLQMHAGYLSSLNSSFQSSRESDVIRDEIDDARKSAIRDVVDDTVKLGKKIIKA